MNDTPNISVREINKNDVDLLADYWFKSDSEYLNRMGAEKEPLPTRPQMIEMLFEQISLPIENKSSYALIWELDGKQIGHSNVNNIVYGMEATMHLHLWKSDNRKRGIGTKLVKKSLHYYFNNLKLNTLICEPYALNPAPNKTLKKVGFDFIKRYRTIPGSLNFEQEVNRWELNKERYEEITQDNVHK